MAQRIRVMRCECGKIHCCSGIGPASRCTCWRSLWTQVWKRGR